MNRTVKVLSISLGSVIAVMILIGIGIGSLESNPTESNKSTLASDNPDAQPLLSTQANQDAVMHRAENAKEDSMRDVLEQKEAAALSDVKAKLKKRAARDWPNDYSVQEYWINEQLEAYERMKDIPDNSVKRQAQRDWPLDFSVQLYWYNEQMEAKERLNN